MAFMDKDFLLKTKTAKHLFFDYAEKAPIFDYHCHLNPKEIYENSNFSDITQAWLGGDHYKWRAMRSMGIDESYITGDKSGLEKFRQFAGTMQYAVGNPLYHWAHLELQRYFDVYEPLCEKNAEDIYSRVNEKLAKPEFRVRELIKKSNVKKIFTTDDPTDDLAWHKKIAEDASFDVEVLPAFRPDKVVHIEAEGFTEYIKKLAEVTGRAIGSFNDVLAALGERIDCFAKAGCVASDHAFAQVPFAEAAPGELEALFQKAMAGEKLEEKEIACYQTAVMQYLAAEYEKRGWAMELHFGTIRNNNTKTFKAMGPDTGFDAAGDYNCAENLAMLLDSIERKGRLPKTVLFTINPKDNIVIGTLMGCFQSAGNISRIQFGTAWWFNDHIEGMRAQIQSLASLGVLGKFIGMLTDSRSFLSYPRHEYFRRILCDYIGELIENGEYAADEEVLEELIKGICYQNAADYFDSKEGEN